VSGSIPLSSTGKAGYANDWIAGRQSTDDRVWWDVDVVRAGKYEVTLMYTCPESDVGARIRAEARGESVEGVLTRAHDPAPIPSPDRVPRGEVYEKVWAPLMLGTLALEKGRTNLTVKALTRPGKAVMELKAVRLRSLQ
jgi:arylsulfatase A